MMEEREDTGKMDPFERTEISPRLQES